MRGLDLDPMRCFFSFKDRFRSLCNRARYERADAFSEVFGRFRNDVVCGAIQVSRNTVWEPLPGPSASAAVALLGHEQILALHLAM